MKDLKEILNESKTSDAQIKDYVASWLRQDRTKYRETSLIILDAMMDFFKAEMDHYEDKSNIASGNQSNEYKDAADLYGKTRDAYQLF